MTPDTRIAEALERIAEWQKHQAESLDHIGKAMTAIYEGTVGDDTDQAFWDRAFCAALAGCLAHYGDAQSDALAANICRAHADAALAARQRRE